MNVSRIWALTKADIKSSLFSHNSIWPLYSPFIFITMADLGISWSDGTGVAWFNIPLDDMCCYSREDTILEILREHFSWAWIVIALFHLLPQLLSRIQDSFLVGQSLWLRLTDCLPYEVAIARATKVIAYCFWIGCLSMFWASFNAFIHNVSFHGLLPDILGIVSYILLSGGFTTVIDFGFSLDSSTRRLIPTISLLIPIFLLIVFVLLGDVPYKEYIPYSAPLITSSRTVISVFGEVQNHFFMAAILGVLLLAIHIASKIKFHNIGVGIESENI